jgi:hypothetical protein
VLNLPHNICTILFSLMDDYWLELHHETRQAVSNLVGPGTDVMNLKRFFNKKWRFSRKTPNFSSKIGTNRRKV